MADSEAGLVSFMPVHMYGWYSEAPLSDGT